MDKIWIKFHLHPETLYAFNAKTIDSQLWYRRYTQKQISSNKETKQDFYFFYSLILFLPWVCLMEKCCSGPMHYSWRSAQKSKRINTKRTGRNTANSTAQSQQVKKKESIHTKKCSSLRVFCGQKWVNIQYWIMVFNFLFFHFHFT